MCAGRQLLVRQALALLVSIGLPPGLAAVGGECWPQFRGPGSSGVSDGSGLPDTWSAAENVVWTTKIPGRGWSSPVVWGDRIFVTSAVQESGDLEPVKKGLYLLGERLPPKESFRWMVHCIDWNTGKILWEKAAGRGVPKYGHHLKNSFASETPVTDGQRVVAYFGSLGVFCYDANGNELWSRKLGERPMRLGWGTAASPVLHGERIYVVNDNEEESFLVALDKSSGAEIWRTGRDEKSNWATPLVWENEKRTEIVTPGSGKVRSYSLDGKLLWELGGMSSITIPTPCAAHGLVYVSSGYVMDRKKPLLAIRPGASGDISLKPDETSNPSVAWCQKMAGPYNPSPLVYGDNVYVLYDRGLLACFDARTGKEIYGKTRIAPKAEAFTASPWAYEGKVFCLSEDGDTFVIQAGPEFKLLRTNGVGELCMATPAIARRSLILRTESGLLRIESRASQR
jgi:outer membrane protein assembly factor BamB